MAVDIVMPNLGFDTEVGRLIEWLKQPGDSIAKGEPIAVVESDKANVELESIASGVVLEHLAAANAEVAIGTVIARVGSTAEMPSSSPDQSPTGEITAPIGRTGRVSPLANRMAKAHQLDLQALQGSGIGGRVTRRDVEQHLQTAPSIKNGDSVLALPKVRKLARERGLNLSDVAAYTGHNPVRLADLEAYQQKSAQISADADAAKEKVGEDVHEISLSRSRQTIGRRLAKSMQEAPHFYVTGEFDLEDCLRRINTFPAPQPKMNDLLQYITIQTLLRVPQLNAVYQDGHLYRSTAIHLAFAVARDEGLITPVVADAQNYSLQGLAATVRELIGRARENRLQPADLQNGTFTISNMGMIAQVEHFTAVINPPQVAILAAGAVKQRPVVRNGGLHIRHTVFLTLSGDHRVVDGMDLAQFMRVFQEELDRFAGTSREQD